MWQPPVLPDPGCAPRRAGLPGGRRESGGRVGEAPRRHRGLAKPSPMVRIPEGWFLMGTIRKADDPYGLEAQFDDTEMPQRRIRLEGVFPLFFAFLTCYWLSGIVITIPPITSSSLKSRFGLFGCALWHPMQAWETARSAYTAWKYRSDPLEMWPV